MAQAHLYILGVNFKSSNFDILGKASFSDNEKESFSSSLLKSSHIDEACIVSTCNRSEIYIQTRLSDFNRQRFEELWSAFNTQLEASDFESFYYYKDVDAVSHLFRVTSGMDSMIPGETEIVGQVKKAFKVAGEFATVGLYLNHLFETSLQTEKKIRTQTAISNGAVSVAYAAVELAQKIVHRMSDKNVLLIGSGETGQLAARHLKQRGIGKIYIANRTLKNAQKLATELDGVALSLDEISHVLSKVDIVLGATSSPNYILSYEAVKEIIGSRGSKPLIMIDIAVPKDFDPEIARFENVFLKDMSSLEKIVDTNKARRREEFEQAEIFVLEDAEKFMQWCRQKELNPTIISLRHKMEDIRTIEIAKYKNRVSEEQLALVNQITRGILNKILHLPLSHLKEMKNHHENVHQKLSLVQEIFELQGENND